MMCLGHNFDHILTRKWCESNIKFFYFINGHFPLIFPPPTITELHPLVCSPASLKVRVYFMMGRCSYLTVPSICLCSAVSTSVVAVHCKWGMPCRPGSLDARKKDQSENVPDVAVAPEFPWYHLELVTVGTNLSLFLRSWLHLGKG